MQQINPPAEIRSIEGVAAPCTICHSSRGSMHWAAEMMFGLGGKFPYAECEECGCVHLTAPPERMQDYYPSQYYSFGREEVRNPIVHRGLKGWVSRLQNEAYICGRSKWSAMLARKNPWKHLELCRELVAGIPAIRFRSRILDVGCGSGNLLLGLADEGFRNLVGVDPYLSNDTSMGPVRIYASDLAGLSGEKFDLIMFHHSLEHIPNQIETLRLVPTLLNTGGVCLIRIPLAGSDPWQRYGTNWVELDAPRHFYLHTVRSMKSLAEQVGMEVFDVTHDSDAFAYWVSELYSRGMTLHDKQTGKTRLPETVFSPEELTQFQHLADEANANGTGGRGRFLLRMKKE